MDFMQRISDILQRAEQWGAAQAVGEAVGESEREEKEQSAAAEAADVQNSQKLGGVAVDRPD